MNDEVNYLVLVHLLCVEISDQETDVVSLGKKMQYSGIGLEKLGLKRV